MKEVKVPHLGYTIRYGVNKKEVGSVVMLCENTDKNTATIYFKQKPKLSDCFCVSHEVMHALQFMCRNRKIAMENELEHMGYLMQYVMCEIFGYEYIKVL